MTVNEKIRTIDGKIEQNRAWYNLYKQTAKMSGLSSGNAYKYDVLASEDDLQRKVY